MMNYLRVALLASTVALGSCAATTTTQDSATILADIQAGTQALCGFVPTIDTILSVASIVAQIALPGSGNLIALAGTGVQAVETDICKGVTPPAAALRMSVKMKGVNGGPVQAGVSPHGVPIIGWYR